ncbi:MAG: hypothetical protein RJA76_763 [Bacteroidota bacterium]|jgi:GT2 family glycosyltransferase
MKVAIVILNYNGKNFLEKFLPKVINNSPMGEIIIADNASTDDSIAFLNSNYKSLRLIQLPVNKGYAGGYNNALKEIKADWFILMNSDIEPLPNWLNRLMDFIQLNPKVKAAQPFIYKENKSTEFEYAGAAGGYLDFLGYPFCRGRIFDTCELDKHQYLNTTDLHWASGACLAVESKTFWEVGGLDEYLFAHQEEIDLCCRIRKAGYQIAAVEESKVLHVGGGTLQTDSPQKTFLNYRNNLILIYKNYQGNNRIKVIMARLLLDGLAGIKFLLDMKWRNCLAIINGHFGFYRYLIQHSEKQLYQKNKKIALYNHSIVWQFFVRKIRKFSDLP